MEIYEMKLHDEMWVDEHNTVIRRVPGGWVYIFYLDQDRAVSQFVPYNNEFQEPSNVS